MNRRAILDELTSSLALSVAFTVVLGGLGNAQSVAPEFEPFEVVSIRSIPG